MVFHTRFAHEAAAGNQGPRSTFFSSGFLAVTLFFLLSGFILSYVYQGKIITTTDLRQFWQARFARIWPLYAVSLIIVTFAMHVYPGAPTAAAVLLMVQSWNPFDPVLAQAWSGVCWTLSVEAFFYLLFPFLQSWLDHRSIRTYILLLAANVALCLIFNISWRTPGYPIYGHYRSVPLALLHTPEFLIGMLVGNLFTHPRHSRLRHKTAFGWLTYMATIASLALLAFRSLPATSLVVITFGMLIFGLASETTMLSRALSTPLAIFGGEISYAMYLLHISCRTVTNELLDRGHIASPSLRFAAYFLATILLAIAAHKAIEVPARNAIRGHLRRRQLRAATSPPSSSEAA